MADMSATDPSDFFKSWEAARLANKDLKPMGPADLKQAELIWRKWLAFCTVCCRRPKVDHLKAEVPIQN